jgi:hypothetical protein
MATQLINIHKLILAIFWDTKGIHTIDYILDYDTFDRTYFIDDV